MKKTLFSAVVTALCVTGILAACTVSFPDDGSPNKFKCESAEDCIEGQICDENEQGQKVCLEEDKDVCEDQDDDGFGANEERNTCRACQENNLCGKDCDDSDPDINPGMVEICDGKDNDCDGETDEPAGTADEHCGAELRDCPLDGSPQQEGTQFGCAQIDGTWQCAVTGSFSGRDACQNKSKSERVGTCQGSMGWEKIATECTQEAQN